MPAKERRHVIDSFDVAGPDHAVLASNVRCLAEGIDVPALDAVMFAHPRRGLIDVTQAVGRVMRPSPTKTCGTVVLPVLATPDAGSRAASAAFLDTAYILSILREHDSDLAAQLDTVRRSIGRGGSRRSLIDHFSGSSLTLSLPRGLSDDFVHAFALKLVAATSPAWWERYGAVEDWAAGTGHANVPNAARHRGVRIGGWVHEQRSLKRRGLLPLPRVDALEALPGWVWSSWDASWDRAFRWLCDYVQVHGTSRVPQSHRIEGFALGAWVKAQRELHSKNRLPHERAMRLDALPDWYWRDEKRKDQEKESL